MGLESKSKPDDLDLEEEAEAEGNENEHKSENENEDKPFFDIRPIRLSSSRAGRTSASDKGNKSEDVDTEDDPVGPITPGPSKFEFGSACPGTAKPREGRGV